MNKREQLKSDSLHQHVANMLADGYTLKSIIVETGKSSRHLARVINTVRANPEVYDKVDFN